MELGCSPRLILGLQKFVLAFLSPTLFLAERRYATYEKEMLELACLEPSFLIVHVGMFYECTSGASTRVGMRVPEACMQFSDPGSTGAPRRR